MWIIYSVYNNLERYSNKDKRLTNDGLKPNYFRRVYETHFTIIILTDLEFLLHHR